MMQQRIKEYYDAVKGRFSAEKSTVTGILALLSFSIIPVQAGLTALIHEIGKEIPDDEIKTLAVALLGVVALTSTVIEAKALKEKQHSASPIATAINITTGRPLEASIIGHISNFAQTSTVLNPVNILSIPAAFSGDGGRLIAENAIAITATLGLWSIAFNTLILKDKAEPVADKVRQFFNFLQNTSRAVLEKLKKNRQS